MESSTDPIISSGSSTSFWHATTSCTYWGTYLKIGRKSVLWGKGLLIPHIFSHVFFLKSGPAGSGERNRFFSEGGSDYVNQSSLKSLTIGRVWIISWSYPLPKTGLCEHFLKFFLYWFSCSLWAIVPVQFEV